MRRRKSSSSSSSASSSSLLLLLLSLLLLLFFRRQTLFNSAMYETNANYANIARSVIHIRTTSNLLYYVLVFVALPVVALFKSDEELLEQLRHAETQCFVLFVGCLSSQQHASVSQGRICSDNFTCCHTEIEAADQTFHLTQSQYTDTGPTSPSADPITPGAWQGSHWSANF